MSMCSFSPFLAFVLGKSGITEARGANLANKQGLAVVFDLVQMTVKIAVQPSYYSRIAVALSLFQLEDL